MYISIGHKSPSFVVQCRTILCPQPLWETALNSFDAFVSASVIDLWYWLSTLLPLGAANSSIASPHSTSHPPQLNCAFQMAKAMAASVNSNAMALVSRPSNAIYTSSPTTTQSLLAALKPEHRKRLSHNGHLATATTVR